MLSSRRFNKSVTDDVHSLEADRTDSDYWGSWSLSFGRSNGCNLKNRRALRHVADDVHYDVPTRVNTIVADSRDNISVAERVADNVYYDVADGVKTIVAAETDGCNRGIWRPEIGVAEDIKVAEAAEIDGCNRESQRLSSRRIDGYNWGSRRSNQCVTGCEPGDDVDVAEVLAGCHGNITEHVTNDRDNEIGGIQCSRRLFTDVTKCVTDDRDNETGGIQRSRFSSFMM